MEQQKLPKRSRQWTRRRLLAFSGIAVLVGLLLGGIHLFVFYRYRMAVMYQMLTLTQAFRAYYEEHQALPADLRTIEATGLFGGGAYRLPRSGWEGWNEHSGPEVIYLSVDNWDGKTPYVIAVQPRILSNRGARHFLVIGDTAVHATTEAKLRDVLSADDKLRAQTGQSRRWHSHAAVLGFDTLGDATETGATTKPSIPPTSEPDR